MDFGAYIGSKSPDFQALRASVLGGMMLISNELNCQCPLRIAHVACKLWGLLAHGTEVSSCMDFGAYIGSKSPDFQALRASVLGGMMLISNELNCQCPLRIAHVACKLWGLLAHGTEGSLCMDLVYT